MSEQRYKITFNGSIESSFDAEEVRKRTQTVFRLSDDKLESFFSGEEYTLKDDVSLEDAKHYEERLNSLGLIAKIVPMTSLVQKVEKEASANVRRSTNADTARQKHKKKSKMPLVILLALILLGLGAFLYEKGFLFFLNNDAQKQPVKKVETPSLLVNTPVISNCTSGDVSNLLKRILNEGMPQLMKKNNPSLDFVFMIGENNQELMFDKERNMRLCGVLAQYQVNGLKVVDQTQDNYESQEKPIVVYEVIYTISLESDDTIKLSTLKQSVVSSNLQTTTSVSGGSKIKVVPQRD